MLLTALDNLSDATYIVHLDLTTQTLPSKSYNNLTNILTTTWPTS